MKFSHWLTLAALITIGFLFWNLREVIIQVFASIILSMALCTLVGKVKSTLSIPRSIALAITLVCLIIFICLSVIIVVPQFSGEFQQLIYQLPSAVNKLWEVTIKNTNRISIFIYGENAKDIINQGLFNTSILKFPDGPSLANGVTDSIAKILGFAGNLGLGLVQLFFIIAVSLMIAIQPVAYREVLILLIPSFYRRRARSILLLCGDALSNWMTGLLISSTFVALLAGIGLYLLGVKLVIANALLAGSLNIIPNIGPTISTIFPMSVAFLDDPWKPLGVLGLYILIQNIESYVITPSVMQKHVKLLPGLTLTAQFLFTIIFGPIGLILAIPLSVVIQVLIKEILINDILDKNKMSN